MSDCQFCPDGHRDPGRQHWAVWVGPERDHDDQPIKLHVVKTGCHHVAESDAEWLRAIISDARYRPTAELLAERNAAEAKLEKVATLVADLRFATGSEWVARMLDNILFPCQCPGEHCGECGCCP